MTVSFWTLGCKLNQAESDCLAATFTAAGFAVVPQKGDLRVINTCTVTSKAEQKMRRIVRLERGDENALLVVTGCAVRKREVQGRVFYLPAQDKPRLTELPAKLKAALTEDTHYAGETAARHIADSGALPAGMAVKQATGNLLYAVLFDWFTGLDPATRANPFVFEQETAEYAAAPRSRPFLKIQDGCGNACTYCAVTIARGPRVSLDKTVVLKRLRSLEDAGFSEAVLTGVNICQYPDLAGLITYLLGNTGQIRLRLSSLEPDAVDDRLLRAVSLPRVRPHFHLSIQSGSDAVLARMGRQYGAAAAERASASLRAVKDDPFLACDIITGFPGETEADFQATYALCEKAAFAWIHAFPFSSRPGTTAAKMRPQIPQREAVARVERLRLLAEAGLSAYEKRWEGRAVEAVVERYDSGSETVSVVTENYLKRKLPREQIRDTRPGAAIRMVDGRVVAPP
jgi:threonylcarbamoyladenosine tRNA methylthiotransferase MtaB